uniref:Uncharacterized protein n=1 Tax=Amorphochlora amoebiformis TaxID=1561963 RepID=A0A7S0H6U6_9EUKA|mmetsp:Transcript_8420/g.13171  ORF Transcript_8420/g.13171 Transcript_8420/m.13171 type:complete len:123 (+) Transcript_8420:10-378(+)
MATRTSLSLFLCLFLVVGEETSASRSLLERESLKLYQNLKTEAMRYLSGLEFRKAGDKFKEAMELYAKAITQSDNLLDTTLLEEEEAHADSVHAEFKSYMNSIGHAHRETQNPKVNTAEENS